MVVTDGYKTNCNFLRKHIFQENDLKPNHILFWSGPRIVVLSLHILHLRVIVTQLEQHPWFMSIYRFRCWFILSLKLWRSSLCPANRVAVIWFLIFFISSRDSYPLFCCLILLQIASVNSFEFLYCKSKVSLNIVILRQPISGGK